MDEVSNINRTGLCVAALYKFVTFPDPAALRAELAALCTTLDLCGTLIVAGEGINGTVSGTRPAIAALIDTLRALPGCADMDVKYSHAKTPPFGRMKVKLKREIVTLGIDGVDPVGNAGTYVEPQDWNVLISDPDTILIDTRNDYEYGIGTFSGAINPETHSFREFPQWFEQARRQWEEGGKAAPKIAMFCTGGIRCEKSTAMARAMGCEDVYHLKGGILRYLEEVPEGESLWRGNCFVFDDRVSVTHGLALTDDIICQDCGRPYNRSEDHSCDADGDWHNG